MTNTLKKLYINWTEYNLPSWWWGGSGDVSWPNSSTDSDIALFDWTTGKVIKDSWKKLSNYQTALSTQTAYSSKGTATKVPQITTNSLWQVTWITEVDIQAGETYTAWEWIVIWTIHSDMQWPCPDGFHIPTPSELYSLKTIWDNLWWWSGSEFWAALKMPLAGSRDRSTSNVASQWSYWNYMTSVATSPSAKYQYFTSSWIAFSQSWSDKTITYAFSIRAFKDTAVIPTSSWTKTYWTSIESWWIFWSATDWLISLSSDGSNWITIADKNLGATTVWNSWDTLSEANCWKYYQRWNNYWFPRTWSVTTSSTQVDASTYWPWNYYNSSTFIIRTAYPRWWESSFNNNLRWWVTQWTWIWDWNTITNTGVLSVNGQTGDISIQWLPSWWTVWQVLQMTANWPAWVTLS